MIDEREDYADPKPPLSEGTVLLCWVVFLIFVLSGSVAFACWLVSGLDIGD